MDELIGRTKDERVWRGESKVAKQREREKERKKEREKPRRKKKEIKRERDTAQPLPELKNKLKT